MTTDSKIEHLEQIGKAAEKLTIALTLITQAQALESYKISFRGSFLSAEHVGFGSVYKKTLLECMQSLAKNVVADRVISVECRGAKIPLAPAQLKRLTLEAWCEGFGLPTPTEDSLKKATSALKAEKDAVRDSLVADLRTGGADGLLRFNAWSEKKIPIVKNFRKIDLQGATLVGARLVMLDFQGANFSNCNLEGVSFYGSDVKNCNFSNANLAGSKFSGTMNGANFSGACMRDARLRGSTLSNADYTDTDFTGADLSYLDLRGTNLSRANLERVTFEYTKFDERTVFPEHFAFDKGLVFSGSGKDPFLTQRIREALPVGAVDFPWFVDRLEKEFDEKRMEKALKMLKAESFQLFAEVTDRALVGVVKSQTSADLFYSCFLKDGGSYSCCSQHLAPCGGLRGALCKHLLVLLIGMTKAGELDPLTSSEWVLASRTRNPLMDKDLMTSTLLRYKGAQAGEVDWRPTETIPEDYYSY